MKGFPGLGLRRSNETAMRGFAVFDKTKTPKRVVLAERRLRPRDHPLLATCRSAGDPATCPKSSFLLVTPPNRRVSVEVHARLAPCAKGRMLVSPMHQGQGLTPRGGASPSLPPC